MSETLFVVLALVMIATLIRAAKGPSWFDRVLAINVFGTLTVSLLALISVLSELPGLLDIALLYGLINFISIVAILRFFRNRRPPDPYSSGVADD